MNEAAHISPWAWLTSLIPSFKRIPTRCADCNRDLDPSVGYGPPTLAACAGFAWVLHKDGRNLCFACADADHEAEVARATEQAKREGRPRPLLFTWRAMQVFRY